MNICFLDIILSTDYLLDVEKNRVIDVSGLSESDIAVVACVAEALKRKKD